MFSVFSGRLSPLITVWLQVRVLPGPTKEFNDLSGNYFAVGDHRARYVRFSFAGRLAQCLGEPWRSAGFHYPRVTLSDGDQNSLSHSFSSQCSQSSSLPRPGCGAPPTPELAIAFELSDVESITANVGGVITANLPQAARNFLRSSSRGAAGSAGAG